MSTTSRLRRTGRIVTGAVIVVIVSALVAVAAVTVLAVRVHGHSMEPTLRDDQRLLIDFTVEGGDVRRFDIVQTRPDAASPPIIKRVIGLPGDAVRIVPRDSRTAEVRVRPAGSDRWHVVRNPAWTNWNGRGLPCCGPDGRQGRESTPAVVPPGRLWLLGDNAGHSDDSRKYGFTDASLVSGRAWLVVWPLADRGGVAGRVRLEPLAGP
ncbi:signal peptidase I [Thermomonospora umbrina]|uniref:Signal peptidase I n=1 Tax=Thermomonospora umbrina TaxID=111806 RepID=A0A3D9SYW3_9ACTN|nr:signal peptidase I [Thermomonospora umbrina]REF01039.1 signal peptidase I [Thermomonospora umbrina]